MRLGWVNFLWIKAVFFVFFFCLNFSWVNYRYKPHSRLNCSLLCPQARCLDSFWNVKFMVWVIGLQISWSFFFFALTTPWSIQDPSFLTRHQACALEKEMAPHSNTLAWKILWMEDPGRLQSMGSQRVRHDWATSLSLSCNESRVLTTGPAGNSPVCLSLQAIIYYFSCMLVMP